MSEKWASFFQLRKYQTPNQSKIQNLQLVSISLNLHFIFPQFISYCFYFVDCTFFRSNLFSCHFVFDWIFITFHFTYSSFISSSFISFIRHHIFRRSFFHLGEL
eukprot:c5889_g1_i2.p2 GENE.c5889_g1_i2~~c5889_g1_i2.p2  ORF type:complete len:104 (+),score=14.23 c5889_g1_i2:284-595(+)